MMSDEPLSNVAVEWWRAALLSMNVMERDEFTGERVTNDFVFEDRRSGFNYGRLDAPDLVDPGSGRRSRSENRSDDPPH